MAPAPAPLQVRGGTGEVCQDIDIREVGPDDEGSGAERASPAQAGPGERGAYEGVADRVYSSLASISIWTFP